MADVDYIALAGSKAKGKRPAYMEDPAVDRVLSITLAVAGELAVARERIDTLERLLEAKGVLSRAEIEAFHPSRDQAYERGLWHREYSARILRAVQQEMEALKEDEPALDQVADDLSRN
jgi:hypothetical protein